jgi:hypothetical protein
VLQYSLVVYICCSSCNKHKKCRIPLLSTSLRCFPNLSFNITIECSLSWRTRLCYNWLNCSCDCSSPMHHIICHLFFFFGFSWALGLDLPFIRALCLTVSLCANQAWWAIISASWRLFHLCIDIRINSVLQLLLTINLCKLAQDSQVEFYFDINFRKCE